MTTVFVYEHLMASGGHQPPVCLREGESLVAEGRAMLDAVSADLKAIPDVLVRTINSDEEAAFRSQASHADFTLVIAPEFDRILETRCRWVEESGGRLLGPTSTAVQLAADKLALFHHFRDRRVPTPTTWETGSPTRHYPVIRKPRYGAGSQDVFFINNADQQYQRTERQSKGESSVLVQEFIVGQAASVAWLIGPGQRRALAPCLQRLSEDGRFHYLGGSTPIAPDLAKRAIAITEQAVSNVEGLRGYVGVDLVLGTRPEDDRVIEINPRLTTSYIGLRQLAKFNLAEMMLAVVRGERLPEFDWHERRVDFTPHAV